MIPELIIDESIELIETEETSKTFLIDNRKERMERKIDELDAMKQAIEKVLSTERYEQSIYSWDYGVELADLFGMPQTFVKSELKRRIEEALLEDDRIESIEDFSVEFAKNTAIARFLAITIFGSLSLEKEVGI